MSQPTDFKTPFVKVDKFEPGWFGLLTEYWQRWLTQLLRKIDELEASIAGLGGAGVATTTESSAVVGITSGGGAGTKGSYETLIAATAAAATSITIVPAVYLTNTVGDYQWILDIAVGAAASEVDIINDAKIDSITDPGGGRVVSVTGPMKFEIAVVLGSRISARCSNRTDVTKDLGVSIILEET
jgi:hypothetical protein